MLTECITRWPQANSPTLWPNALRYAHHNLNNSPELKITGKVTPLEALSGIRTRRYSRGYIPFGCPVYSTKDEGIDGKSFNKWMPRSTLSICLGGSPLHSRRAGLILNLTNGILSPKCHFRPDRIFVIVHHTPSHLPWKVAAGLMYHGHLVTKPSSAAENKPKPHPQLTTGRPSRDEMDERPPRKTCVRKRQRPNRPKASASKRLQEISFAENISKHKEAHRDRPAVRNRNKCMKIMHTVKASRNEEVIDAYMALDIEYDHNDTVVMMKVTTEKNSMYYHQAMKKKDWREVVSALNNELTSIENSNTYTVRKRDDLPSSTKFYPWSGRCDKNATRQQGILGKIKIY